MDLSALRNVSEERVCAALGVPAAVVGFGTGLEPTKVGATMRELVGLAWSACLVPTQRIIAGQVAHALLPEFEGNPERYAVDFDRSRVSALREDEDLRAARWNSEVQAGYVMVSEARRAFGLPGGKGARGVFATAQRGRERAAAGNRQDGADAGRGKACRAARLETPRLRVTPY